MLTLNDAFEQANTSYSRQPVFVAKILNTNQTVYLTSSEDVMIDDPGSEIFAGVISSATGQSQDITPERGISTIGGISINVVDQGLTEHQRDLLNNNNDTFNNNKVELYYGFADILFSNYIQVTPMYISGMDQGINDYTFKLSDTQRFVKQKIFTSKPKTVLVNGLGFSASGEIEVVDSSEFIAVEHDANWRNAPSATVGYLIARGVDKDGLSTNEVLRWTTKSDSTHFTIDARGLFGTRYVDLKGTQQGGSIELEEFIYLDLNVPKMIIALMTGDLYGQVAQTIPDHWHAGVDATKISIPSFENIGDDLWNFNLEFVGMKEDSAKEFIAEQCMAPLNLFQYINQNGELTLKRFTSAPFDAPGDFFLDNDSITNNPNIERDAKAIRNVFRVNWEWDFEEDKYARENGYIDADSFARNNIWSVTKDINLKGIRNRDRESQTVIGSLAEGIRARFSEPAVKPVIECLMRDAIQAEVGDLVRVNLGNQPDFTSDDTLDATFEIQSVQWDFLRGTMRLKLFGNSGRALPITFEDGVTQPAIDFAGMGWTNVVGTLTGTEGGGEFTIDTNQTIGSPGTITKIYYDGDIRIANGVTLTGLGSIWFGCNDFYITGSGVFDLSEGGELHQQGFFGGADSSQEGMHTSRGGFLGLDRYVRRDTPGNDRIIIASKRSSGIENIVTSIDSNNRVVGLPLTEDLYGNSGGRGGDLSVNASIQNGYYDGTDGGLGGGGCGFVVDNLFFDNPDCIDVSGADNNPNPLGNVNIAGTDYRAGVGGFGWPGAVLCFIKNNLSPLPNLSGSGGAVRAITGNWSEPSDANDRPKSNGDREYNTPGSSVFHPYLPAARSNKLKEWNKVCTRSFRVKFQDNAVLIPGVDKIENTGSPLVSVVENVNTPESPLANISTLELTATGADAFFSHALFEYRLQGQETWYPANYGITNESTVEVISDGSTYEIRATAYNEKGIAGGITETQFTVSVVNRNPGQSAGGVVNPPTNLTVPKIKRLELVNRINDEEGWDEWKSPTAQFRWAKLSTTAGGSIINVEGVTDLHLEGYKVRIKDSSTGNILREEITKDSFYDYTFEKNKKDTASNPVRGITFDVQPLTSTGYVSEPVSISVSNPQPAAPVNTVVNPGFTSIQIIFDLPSDADFVGVDAFLLQGTGDPYASGVETRVAGNSYIWENLIAGQTYTIGLRSVDQFGNGGQISSIGITTNLIQSTQLGNITTPVVIDEVGGRFITNNSGYIAFHGAVSVPAESANPLIFGAYNNIDYPFWIDAAGAMKLEALAADSAISVGSATFATNGIQLEANSGNPRSYIGDGADRFMKYENAELTIGDKTKIFGLGGYDNDRLFIDVPSYLSATGDVFNEQDAGITITQQTVGDFSNCMQAVCSDNDRYLRMRSQSSSSFNSMDLGGDWKCKYKIAGRTVGSLTTYAQVSTGNVDNKAGFRFKQNNLGSSVNMDIYAFYTLDGIATETLIISNVNWDTARKFEIIYDSTTDLLSFYVDDTLESSPTVSFSGASNSTIMTSAAELFFNNSSGITTTFLFGDFRLMGSL